jgi:hypothetical protein
MVQKCRLGVLRLSQQPLIFLFAAPVSARSEIQNDLGSKRAVKSGKSGVHAAQEPGTGGKPRQPYN